MDDLEKQIVGYLEVFRTLEWGYGLWVVATGHSSRRAGDRKVQERAPDSKRVKEKRRKAVLEA